MQLEGMLKTLKADDEIEGSSQLARAVWALGRIGKPSSPAQIARTIRARTSLNWEGSQAGRFFRTVFETGRFASWFVRKAVLNGSYSPRYLYDLSDHARAYFQKTWVDGDWKPPPSAEKKEPAPRGFREKDHTEAGKDRRIEELEQKNKFLTEQLTTVTSLLNRIHSCHYGKIEAVMADIDAYMAGYKGVQG